MASPGGPSPCPPSRFGVGLSDCDGCLFDCDGAPGGGTKAGGGANGNTGGLELWKVEGMMALLGTPTFGGNGCSCILGVAGNP